MVYTWNKKITSILREGPCFQSEIKEKLGEVHKIVLRGYLKCLVDLDIIKCKDNGRTIVYYTKENKR